MPYTLQPGMSFEERNAPEGVYATCFKDFSTHPDSLSQLEFIEDFHGETETWPPDRLATRFFRPSDPITDLVVVLFGEVLDEEDGTGLGARGGSKRSQFETTDASKIRDVVALGAPTGANEALSNLFRDQIITLRQVVQEFRVPACENSVKRTQWVKFKANNTEPTIISVNLPYKYSRPKKPATPVKLQKRASDMDVSDSKSDEISLKSTYEPERMSDFDPKLSFDGARLVQQPLFDQDAQLVPPWNAPFVFRKGALVAIEAHLSIFHFLSDPKPNHLYQLSASRIKLLAPSPLVYESKPTRPLPTRRRQLSSRSSMFSSLPDVSGGAAGASGSGASTSA